MRKIVLTTVGTLGDLHPFIAIGLALKRRGHHPVLAVAKDHVAKARAAGLDAVAVLPSFDTIRERMGLGEDDAVKRVMADQTYLLEQVLLPWLESSTAALDEVVDGASVLVGSLFVFGAPIIAEKRRVPLISVILQPMAILSVHTPPKTPDFWMLIQAPGGPIGVRWNRLAYGFIRKILRHRYGRKIDEVRASHGLGPASDPSMFDVSRESALTLCCYSPLFGPPQKDAPANTEIVGFPVYDSQAGDAATPDPELEAFLADGPPPLVFTLGSFAVYAPGDFYEEAAATARLLGARAVLLTGDKTRLRSGGDILVRAYAPHSMLFPRAAAIIHHGGIGTTGQALRAGKPQLVVPHMGDQSDNAHRIRKMGIGLVLKARRFTARRAAPLIASLLGESAFRAEAERIGALIAPEEGAEAAAIAIERLVTRS
ncbi:MAG: glycosyl transferase family 2 [Sphingomonas bacterium]|uniref:glycosyltransferase n=1 Tax=Sphingomonas bacterium TaxID=1895847 RepID=UPI0026025A34|nr:glycosyltransferase [Sphingomonas bacterium]MDB5704681.1 glycosyl transferase family 2 [Sphingomonas bacterium]